ncbi:MAG: hypothetical protein ABEH81_10070 [Halopenitus sp.]
MPQERVTLSLAPGATLAGTTLVDATPVDALFASATPPVDRRSRRRPGRTDGSATTSPAPSTEWSR